MQCLPKVKEMFGEVELQQGSSSYLPLTGWLSLRKRFLFFDYGSSIAPYCFTTINSSYFGARSCICCLSAVEDGHFRSRPVVWWSGLGCGRWAKSKGTDVNGGRPAADTTDGPTRSSDEPV